jgi:hypothetical protein
MRSSTPGRRRSRLLAGAALALLWPIAAAADPQVHERTILSDVYDVDGLYKSMMGPFSTQKVTLEETLFPELFWIVGYEARMVAPDGRTPMSQEFMCHSNLDIDSTHHRQLFGWSKNVSGRLFTLSQGQFEIDFPDGFGIPILSTEELDLTTQVLNHNRPDGEFQVRHHITIRYVRDRELKAPMRPLYASAASGLVSLDGERGFFSVEEPEEQVHGPGCLPGEGASGRVIEDSQGRRFAGHWVVKPGREVNRTNVTRWMALPFDTTVHYIAVHLHPFAESLELRDLTTGETLFKSHARPPEKGIGLAHVDYFSSAEGIALYTDHEYEIVSVYDNTSGTDQDSMAVMYLYLLDQEYRRPAVLMDPVAARSAP